MVFQLIAEEEMPPAIDAAIRRLLCECFPADADAFARSRAWHESAPAFTVIGCDQGRLCGHIGMIVRTIVCQEEPVTVAGVQNFCVAPAHRGSGLSRRLMERAVSEARRRSIPFGLLFCVSELERLYCSLGWSTIAVVVTMLDEHRCRAPLPGKNIAMVAKLGTRDFPAGDIDLQGRDW